VWYMISFPLFIYNCQWSNGNWNVLLLFISKCLFDNIQVT
jgi:hypothetical protein